MSTTPTRQELLRKKVSSMILMGWFTLPMSRFSFLAFSHSRVLELKRLSRFSSTFLCFCRVSLLCSIRFWPYHVNPMCTICNLVNELIMLVYISVLSLSSRCVCVKVFFIVLCLGLPYRVGPTHTIC